MEGGSVRSSSDLSAIDPDCFSRPLCSNQRSMRVKLKRIGSEREKKRGNWKERSELIFSRSSIVATLPRKTDSEMPAPDRPRPIFHLHIRHLPLQFEGSYKQRDACSILESEPRSSATFVFSRKFSSSVEFSLHRGVEGGWSKRRTSKPCRNFRNSREERFRRRSDVASEWSGDRHWPTRR